LLVKRISRGRGNSKAAAPTPSRALEVRETRLEINQDDDLTEAAAALAAAAAALEAAADAVAAARSAATTQTTALAAAKAAGRVAAHARYSTAAAVAAAAASTAEIAALAATAVELEAATRAAETAAFAVEARQTIAAELPPDADKAVADRAAAAVAATVAADVVATEHTTAAAASTVAAAVATAAASTARIAQATAFNVELEAAASALASDEVAHSSATTAAATGVVLQSAKRASVLAARAELAADLRDSEHRFSITFEHATVGMLLVSLSGGDAGRVLRVNPALRHITGRTEAELLGLSGRELFVFDDAPGRDEMFATLLSGRTSAHEAVMRWQHADGHEIWVRANLHAIREFGRPAYAVGQVEDISERRRAEAALTEREERFRLAFDNALTGMMFLSVDGGVRKVNKAMSSLLGFTEQELLGASVQSLACHEEQASIGAGLVGLFTGEISAYQAEHSFWHADGRVVWGLVSGSLVYDVDDRPDYLIFQVKDVTGHKLAESQLVHQALHDDLTGLPNRVLLGDHLELACARAERDGSLVGVLFVDIDDFKEINDSLGHVSGDAVLVEVAGRISGCLRGTDTAARLGGDEFVVVCEGLADATEANAVARRIDQAIAAPLTARLADVNVTVSIGISTGGPSSGPTELLRGADTAMYEAKANGKDRYEVYNPAMSVSALRHVTVAGELSHALARDELRLFYQPTYDMLTGAICGVEALLRWQHPTRGLLAPADFLDVAEGRRLMIPIGDWVIATAAGQASEWQLAFGQRAPDMWVNIAGQQLGKQHLIGVVERILDDTGLKPTKFGLEITETQLVGRAEAVTKDLVDLHGLGLQLAIDDFGTGFASLEYLRRFAFDELKIDQSFVGGLGRDRTDSAVTASVIALGRSLDLVVVAEGVETNEQYDLLTELHCDLAQGYLMQRPAPAEAITLLLTDDVRYAAAAMNA
jgi:diguanylate cyclase (GGDEF)-like protein/PAS domain S-box-containing protein